MGNTMEDYEKFRDEIGWKCYFNDIAFKYNETPTAKVINYFCKRKPNEPEVDITKTTEKVVDYEILCDVEWVKFHLDHKLKYTRKYNEYILYLLSGLQLYLNQALDGGYGKMILSKQEFASIAPKKK